MSRYRCLPRIRPRSRVLVTLGLALVACLAPARHVHAQRAGDRVIVIRPGAPQTCGRKTIDHIAAGIALRVHLTLGDQLLVSSDYPGWIRRADVVAESQAIDHFTLAILAERENIHWYLARAACFGEQGDYQNALKDLERAQKIAPRTSVFALVRSQIHARQHNFEQALIDAKTFLEEEPDSAVGHNMLAAVHAALGHDTEANEAYLQAAKLMPDASRYVAAGAAVRLRMGDSDSALQGLDQAIRLNPFEPLAFYLRGSWYGSQDDFTLALADLDRAIALEPKHALAYHHRAICHAELDQLELAKQDVDVALLQDDAYAESYYLRAAIFQKKHDWTNCAADLTRALKLNPGNVKWHALRGRVLHELERDREALADVSFVWFKNATPEAQQEYEWYKLRVMPLRRADSLISRTLRDDAQAPPGKLTPFAHDRVVVVNDDAPLRRGKQTIGHLQRGDAFRVQLVWRDELLVSNGQPGWIRRSDIVRLPEAAAFFSQQIAADPHNSSLYCARASAHFEERHFDAALADVAMALKLSPQSTRSLVLRSKIRIEQRELQSSLEDAELVLGLDPQSYAGHIIHGQALFALDRYAEAIASYTRAAQLKPASGEPLAWRAHALIYLKDVQAAERDLDAAIALDSYNAWTQSCVAWIHHHAQRSHEATAAFNRAIALDPDFSTIKARINYLLAAKDEVFTAAAANDADEAIELEPENADTYLLRARIAQQQKDDAAVRRFTSKAIDLDPTNAEMRYYRSRLHAVDGHFSAALADVLAAVKCISDPPHKWLAWRGTLRLLTGNPQDSLADLSHLPEDTPNAASFKHLLLAIAAISARDEPLATREIAALRMLEQTSRQTPFYAALAHLSQRDYAATLLECDACLSTYKYHANTYLMRGIAHLQSDQAAEALADLNEALRLKCASPKTAYLARSKARAALGDQAGSESDLKLARQLDSKFAADASLEDAAVETMIESILEKLRSRIMKEPSDGGTTGITELTSS